MEISNEDFKKLIYQATDMITDWYDKKLRGSKIYNNKSPAEIRETFKIKSKNKGKYITFTLIDFNNKNIRESDSLSEITKYLKVSVKRIA